MIPFVKLHTRRFHVTSNIFFRKMAPKISSNDYKHEISENNSDSSSSFEGSCPDYLGIESEKNVITVKPQKHRFQHPQTGDNREKFYRASFGIVRFDADNKIKRHGQYKITEDFTFPQSSSEAVKVSPISETYPYKNPNMFLENSQKHSVVDTLNNKNSEPTSSEKNSFDTNYIDEFYFGTSETQKNNTQQPKSEDLNYLEKDYFETLVNSRNFSVGQTTSNYAGSKEKVDFVSCDKSQVEELNYLEKDTFETLTDSENLHLDQNSANYSNPKTAASSLSDKNQSEETNYLEKDYFEALKNSESHFVKQNISNYTDYEDKISPVCDNINDQKIFSKNNILTPANDELSFLDKNLYENNSSSDIQNTSHYADIFKSSSHFVENNNIIDETMHKKSIERKQDGKIKDKKEASDSVFTDNNVSELNEKQSYEKLKKLSSSEAQKKNIMSHKSIGPSTKNSNTSEELCDEPLKSFSMKNNFQFSKPVSEEPDPNNSEISTAHDFVQKLREEQKIPSQILVSKKKSANEDKVDSKGFRILKNQVPDLTYFTRDEILTILKQNIVYSDDDLLILNKPYSLVIHESKTTKEPCLSTFLDVLAKEMDKQSRNPKLITVHRLDKETTGCLLLASCFHLLLPIKSSCSNTVASIIWSVSLYPSMYFIAPLHTGYNETLNETMAMHLKALFAQRKIVKKYWIMTAGVPDPPEGVIDIPISEGSINNRMRMVLHPKLPSDITYKSHSKQGKPAVTTYKVISESGNAALVEVFPKTGVKHQIRVHFGFGLGCPVLGDHKYSHLDKLAPQRLPSDLLQKLHVRQSKVRHIPMHIHAKSVGIPEYFDKRDLFVNIPIPDHFKINLKRLKFRKKDMIH